MKKILLLASALLLPALPPAATAQAEAPKILLIIRDYGRDQMPTEGKFDFALLRAVQMKKAGVAVSVAFEDKAVLCFLDLHGELDKPGMKNKVKGLEADIESQPKEKKARADLRPQKYWLAGRMLGLPPERRAVLEEFLALKIPYTVSAHSARELDVFAELKAAGEPLTQGSGREEDLSPYLKQGYTVIIH